LKEDVTVVDVEHITTKYTGHRVELDAMIAAHRRDGLAAALAEALERAADAVADAETELTRLARSITDRADVVSRTIDAEAGEQLPTLNPLGELQATGPRFDAVIAVRADRITHLRTLVRLWRQLPNGDDATA
jgi:hypothetical protein